MLILGMVWSLILRYNVQDISEGDKTAKEGLLLWAKTKVGEVSKGSVLVNNFHTSWQDGLAFNCLIQAYRPDLVQYQTLNPKNKVDNLNHAFDLAEKHLGIPKLLDAADMVAMRPDEKSVMTYVSFFWKAFAANKRKKIAGERITKVVQREQAYADLQAQYLLSTEALAKWIKAKTAFFGTEPNCNSQAELEVEMRKHVMEYGRVEKPSKQQELLDLEALFSSISSRLATLGRTFTPDEDASIAALHRWWEELTLAEEAYETNLRNKLKNLKKVEYYIKLFHSKAGKLEDWLKNKEVWLGKEVPETLTSEGTLPTVAPPPADEPEEESSEAVAPASSPAPAPEHSPSPDGTATLLEAQRVRQSSFFGFVGSLLQGKSESTATLSPLPVAAAPAAAPSTAGSIEKPPPVDMRHVEPGGGARETMAFKARLPRGNVVALFHGMMDSVAAVQAKLNMLAAHDEELAGRRGVVPELDKLLKKIMELGCPPMRQFSLTNRTGAIKQRIQGLEELGSETEKLLREEHARQQKMDQMRLDFAKKAEALNQSMEERIDVLTEIFVVDTVAEAEQQVGEIDGFRETLAGLATELESISSFDDEMRGLGIQKNPYSRFELPDLEQMMALCKAALDARHTSVRDALARQRELDDQKKAFAAAAAAVVEFVNTERAKYDDLIPAISIKPDDSEAIARGKQMLAELDEHMSPAARGKRAAQLLPAQELSDKLMEAAELDNPYTRETIMSLKTQTDRLGKMLRDKRSFVEGQLARAQAEITPEQYEEIRKVFTHFDKSGDGLLNRLEFTAAIKAMDFELTADDEDVAFERLGKPLGVESAPAMNLEAFTTFILQQYKDKDTKDTLLAAFLTVAGGKEVLTAADIRACIPAAEADYLLSQLNLRDGDHGLEYGPFAATVYGGTP